MTIASWYLTTGDEAYVDTTIIDGGGGAAVVSIPAGAEDGAAFVGLTIQNGDDGISLRAKIDLLRSRLHR